MTDCLSVYKFYQTPVKTTFRVWYLVHARLDLIYLELWVGLAAYHGDVGLSAEPGCTVRVLNLHALQLHAPEVQVRAEGKLCAFSHLLRCP
jgi:hypothetical protein